MTINKWNAPSGAIDELSARKLTAFARIEDEFIASFSFVQEVHGQRRFAAFPLANTVRYLHALYLCECKDRLLGIFKDVRRYEGERCLELLRGWQEGHTAEVVAFVHRKLDNQPFAEVSEQIEETARTGDLASAHRLASGRVVLLNRNFNLSHALDAMFALEPEQLRTEVRALCAQAGHAPEEIARQLAELRSEVYAYASSAALARRNMLVMNRIGSHILKTDGDRPGERTNRVRPPASAAPPSAEETIPSEMTLVSMSWSSPRRLAQTVEASRDASASPMPTEPILDPTANDAANNAASAADA
jgi:hypothetical protein